MIHIEQDTTRRQKRFLLSPNQSISWPQLRLVFAGLCVFSLTIAASIALLGYWPVLPFTGLELIAVGISLYIVARRGQIREIISIDADADFVLIERGRRHPEKHWKLPRNWARVALEEQPKQWYPSRLYIRSQGRTVEIGSFLNEHERQLLATELSRNLGGT